MKNCSGLRICWLLIVTLLWLKEQYGPTRYEQFMDAMANDERFLREQTLGKRIGLYKFRGDLGIGNFSKVKLAYHQLAHGTSPSSYWTCWNLKKITSRDSSCTLHTQLGNLKMIFFI